MLGFGAVFALWLVSTYELMRRLSAVETRAFEISTRFAKGEELLFTVRAEVLLGSVYVRDAVLDVEPDSRVFYEKQLASTRVKIEEALRQYLPDVDSEVERDHWTRLEAELRTYWGTVAPVLGGDISRAEAQELLGRDVIPKRSGIIRISDDLRTLNRDALRQHQAEVARLYAVVRQRVWWTSGIAVLLGLAVALVAARHAGRLEALIRLQHIQERNHKRDLQRLTAKLVHAQEEQRRTIARDLHDEVGQALTAVRMGIAVLERRSTASMEAQSLADVGAMMDGVIRTVRDLSQLLHPAMLDDFGLAVTLQAYVDRFSTRTGVRADLIADGLRERLAPELEICIYRIAQEALTNVAKHSQATACRVLLQRYPTTISLTVEDNGRGMEDRSSESGEASTLGLGLMGIRERVAELGGTARWDCHASRGTRLVVELPVRLTATTADAQMLIDGGGGNEQTALVSG
jgi:signal transduction histidine kinase